MANLILQTVLSIIIVSISCKRLVSQSTTTETDSDSDITAVTDDSSRLTTEEDDTESPLTSTDEILSSIATESVIADEDTRETTVNSDKIKSSISTTTEEGEEEEESTTATTAVSEEIDSTTVSLKKYLIKLKAKEMEKNKRIDKRREKFVSNCKTNLCDTDDVEDIEECLAICTLSWNHIKLRYAIEEGVERDISGLLTEDARRRRAKESTNLKHRRLKYELDLEEKTEKSQSKVSKTDSVLKPINKLAKMTHLKPLSDFDLTNLGDLLKF